MRSRRSHIECSFLPAFVFLVALPHVESRAQDSGGNLDSLIAVATFQREAGELDSAKNSFEAALDIDKKSIAARIGLGQTYIAEKEWRSARNEFETALKSSPANLEAQYYAAICYREMGKAKGGPFRTSDWNAARKHFQSVVKADSSFKDVLHQYSILEEYDKEFEHALRLAHAGLGFQQDLLEPQMDLFKLYHHFIAVSDTEDSFAWLRSHSSSYARYFTGEVFRSAKRTDDATRVFEGMLQSDSLFPRQASLLSLVRITIDRGDSVTAEELYWQAVESIRTQFGAELVFDDIKYIMSDEELRIYRTLATLERKRAFFRAFWNLRNPLAGRQSNARLVEHYRRMLYAEVNFTYYGFRIWFNNPDKTAELRFPQSYALNHKFNDKGLIYLRHGPPDEIERAAGLGLVYTDPNESWLYRAVGESPKRIFHFISISGNWRLAPLPTDARMYEALAPWDSRYGRLTSRIQLERLNTSETLTELSRENVTVALSTDEHNWKRDVQRFRIPASVDAFRSVAGRSLLNISYAIPMPAIARLLPENASRASCEVGISLTNLTTRAVVNKLDTISFIINRRSLGFITNLVRYTVKPDSYAIALHVHPLGVEAFGRWGTRKRVQDFSSEDVLLSDVEFLMPSNSASSIELQGMLVMQVPFSTYSHGTPIYVYYEVYNLAEKGGKKAYTKECFLTPADDERAERRILLLKADSEFQEELPVGFDVLNIDKVKPGKYNLSVRITDRHRPKSSERSRVIEIVD